MGGGHNVIYSAEQYSVGAGLCSAVISSAVQCSLHCNAVQYSSVQYSVVSKSEAYIVMQNCLLLYRNLMEC